MNLEEIIKQCSTDSEEWFPEQAVDPFFVAACTAGEIGEAINLLKKWVRGTHEKFQIKDELEGEVTDTFIYLMNLIGILDFDIVEAYKKKRAYNQERFGNNA